MDVGYYYTCVVECCAAWVSFFFFLEVLIWKLIYSSNESVLYSIIIFQIYSLKKRDFSEKILKKSEQAVVRRRFLQNFFLKSRFFGYKFEK